MRLAAAGHARPWSRVCDVRDVAALQQAIADAAQALGDFHVLVNNVASDDRHALEAVTPAYYDERIAVNQRAALFALQAVVPGMRRLGGGSIVNLGSISWQIKQARPALLRHRQVGRQRPDARHCRTRWAATASASTPCRRAGS